MGGVLPHRCFRPPWVLTWWGMNPSDSLTVALLNYALLTAFGTVSCGSMGHPSLSVNLKDLLTPNSTIYFQM